MGTDRQLPQTSVSGIAVSYQDTNDLFICTGNGDRVHFDKLHGGQGNGRTTPIFTSGIYRSVDYGETWTAINDGFLSHFSSGGTCRNILVDPTDANVLFVISTEGIFKTSNALSSLPTWNKLTTISGISKDYSGLKFHPTNSNVIYAASNDIIKSTNKGANWSSMTGPLTGLDFATLPDSFQVIRIKLEVTPADTTRLYAYIIGSEQINGEQRKVIYIYQFKNGIWSSIWYSQDSAFSGPLPRSKDIGISLMGFAVSTVDPEELYFGSIELIQLYDITNPALGGNANWAPHDDIHALVFEPNKVDPGIFAGSHGGVAIGKQYPPAPYRSIKFKPSSKGINTSLLWSLDVSNVDKAIMIMGRQDNGTHITTTGASNGWTVAPDGYGSGDGYGVAIANDLDNSKQQFYISSNENSSLVSPYDAYTVSIDPSQNGTGTAKEYKPVNFKVKEHPLSNKPIFGLSELYTEADTLVIPFSKDSWQIQSDIYSDTLWKNTWERQIVDFDIAPSNSDYVYIATYGRRGNHETDLFRSTTGLSDGKYIYSYSGAPVQPSAKFIPITGNLPTINYNGVNYDPYVTGIAVSATNHMDVWVSVSGFHPNFKVFKSSDGGDTWTNADPNGCLPNLPTNGIEYQDRTDDRLYLAMDDGVYVTDGSMSGEWKRFGDLPNTMVNTMFMNSCSNRLYVGTYGRGIWSTKLLPRSGDASVLIIDTNTIWNDNKFLHSDILITAGNKLTIKGTLFMSYNANIKVEPNAILEVDSGMITNGCDKFWGGIHLWGDRTKDQLPLNQPTYQAKVVLKNGAVLENARHAITQRRVGWGYSAGLIQADSAIFRNCYRAAEFMSHTEVDNSYFRNCTFVLDSNFSQLTKDTANALSQITMWNVKGVKFKGCTFINNSDYHVFDDARVANGIHTIDAGFTVDTACLSATSPCPAGDIKRSSFTNLNHGIFSLNEGSSNTIAVSQTDFTDNSMAFRIEALDNVAFNKNEVLTGGLFKTGYGIAPNEFNFQMGYYSNASSGYSVERNTFEGRGSPVMDVAGVYVKSSGPDANEIYKNTFKNNEVGEFYEGRNKNSLNPYEGLQFLCNTNPVTNEYDVQTAASFPRDGIRTLQGDSVTSASNLFSNPSGSAVDAHIKNDAASINYYYRTTPERPTKTYNTIVKQSSATNSCPNQALFLIPSGGFQVPQIEINAYYAERSAYDDLLYNYIQSIDNGNTDSLKAAIGLYFPSQAQSMRDNLMLQAPYLSTGALMNAANTGILTDALLLEICLANPSATQAGGFLDFIEYAIPNPLPSSMIQLIYQSWGETTARSILENQLAAYNEKLGRMSNQILHFYQMDEIDHYDSIVSLIESRKTLNSKYRLIELAMSKNDYTTTTSLFNYIENNYTLTAWQNAEHINFKDYIGVRQSLFNSSKDYVDLAEGEQELIDLRLIAANNTGRSSALAQSILCFVFGECSDGGVGPALRRKTYPKRVYDMTKPIAKPLYQAVIEVELHPNPTSSMVQLSVIGLEEGQAYVLQLNNLQGQKVMEKQFSNAQQLIDVNHLKKGSYLYQVVVDETTVSNGKLVIQ